MTVISKSSWEINLELKTGCFQSSQKAIVIKKNEIALKTSTSPKRVVFIKMISVCYHRTNY